MRLPNLARREGDSSTWPEVDGQVLTELNAAGIEVGGPFEWHRKRGEVPTAYLGSLCGWGFTRLWYYWAAEGPGIPADRAEPFHIAWGREVRVDGHCGCPSPLEWFKGFAVGCYHIDTLDGLVAFADLLRAIYIEPKPGG